MKKPSIALKVTFALSTIALAAATPALAVTAPAVQISDGVNSVTIDSSGGAPVFSAGCSNCSTSSVSVTAGTVVWGGTLGSFSVSSVQGSAQTTSYPNPDLSVQASYSGAVAATLTVKFTSTGFTGTVYGQAIPQTNFSVGSGSVNYSYYTDNTNTPFGTGSLVGTLNNMTGGVVIGPKWPTVALGTYSATEVEAISFAPGAGNFLGDNEFDLNPSTLSISCAVSDGKLNTPYNSSVSVSGGTGPYSYVIIDGALAPGLNLNASTGAITGTPTAAGTYSYTIQVVDAAGTPALSVCGQTIALGGGGGQGGITLACPSNLALTQGAYYSSSFVATGGIGVETFTISAGTLPAGLMLKASTGAISGTPTGSGSFTFTGKVVDSSTPPQTATSLACSGTVAPKPTALKLTCAATSGTVGTAYSSAVVATGGTPPYVSYTLTGGSLPPGLTLNKTTGAITGTPTKAGTYSYTVQVIDTNGAKASDGSGSGRCSSTGCSITIAGPPALTLKCPTSTATVGGAYSSAATVVGGTAPFTFSVSAGSLPKGLTLNTSTGAITGTPTTSGTSNFTLKVKDSTGKTDDTSDCSGGCSIKVSASINITCPENSATLNKSYSSTPKVTGGTGPYKWSISSGSLPPGLSLNTSTGAITGTPTKAGTYSVTLKVVDKNGLVGVSSCNSCSNNNNGGWGSGWGSWDDDDNNDTNCSCTITVTDPNANSSCGSGSDGWGSGWGWGW